MLNAILKAIFQPGLRDRVRTLEKRLDEVEVEWADWYHKFRALHARLAKAEHRAAAVRSAGDGEDQGGTPDLVGRADRAPRRLGQDELKRLVRGGASHGVLRPPFDEQG
jgi:hypothetical protein